MTGAPSNRAPAGKPGDTQAAHNDRVIASLQKNKRETIRVTLGEYQGFAFIGLRIWEGEGAAAIPTRKGLAIPPRLARAFINAIEEALAAVRRESPGDG